MQNKIYTLITGSGESPGKPLAIECAKRHMNLVLVVAPVHSSSTKYNLN